jgi:hypothetical protein
MKTSLAPERRAPMMGFQRERASSAIKGKNANAVVEFVQIG